MNRDEFRDALCLRYVWHLKKMAHTCECGAANDIDHALICKLGGFVIMRHNAVRDVEADFLRNVCKDVSVEPGLIHLTGNEELAIGSKVEAFWKTMQEWIFLVEVFGRRCRKCFLTSVSHTRTLQVIGTEN